MSNFAHIQLTLKQRWQHGSSIYIRAIWYLSMLLLVSWGWHTRDEDWITAENGIGYALGIVGSSLMLLLLTYSLRKRWKRMRRVLTVKFWFRLHMTLGLLGPVAILFHCNFRLASLNSTIALICMALVTGSGLLGRYLYKRIHYGLYGKEIKIKEILNDFKKIEVELINLSVLTKQKKLVKKLFLANETLTRQQNSKTGILETRKNNKQAKKISKGMGLLIKHIAQHYKNNAKSRTKLNEILKELENSQAVINQTLIVIPNLKFSERLFSLWHVVHIPIYALMVISVIVHIWAVHMY